MGGWKGGKERERDYIAPRTGHSVYELPHSLSRFQRFSYSFFLPSISLVFVGRDLHRHRFTLSFLPMYIQT